MKFSPKIAAALLCASLSLGAQAASYGNNLIINGNAENGTTGWSAIADDALFSSVAYGPNWVQPTQPGPVDRGSSLFVGGSGWSYAAGTQTIDLSGYSSAIASGQVSFSLTGWLGGWAAQGDNAIFQASFLDIAGNELGSATLGPLSPADRNEISGLFYQEALGLLPTGTTQVRFVLDMERQGGGDNDGYADNLSFVLNTAAVPEPESYALMLAGLGLLAGVARRRSRRAA